MRTRNLPLLAALALAIAGLPFFARSAAAAPITTTGRPLAPAIGFAPRFNTYLLVWAEDRGHGTGLDLYAARVTSSGIVVGREYLLVGGPGDQSDPTLAFSNRVTDYLVIYTNTGGGGGYPTPGVPIPGTPGAPVPGTPGLPTPPGPPLAALAGVVSPEAARAAARGDAVAAPFEYSGPEAPAQPTFPPLPTPGPSPTPGPTALPGQPTATPGALPPPANAPGSRDLWGVWAAESGQQTSNTFAIITSPADDTFPSLTYRQGTQFDQYALVWREVNGTSATISSYQLQGFGRHFYFDSAKNNVVAGGDVGRPSVAVELSGEFLVVWSQTKAGEVGRDIFGRRMNLNAFPLGPTIKVVDGPADQVYPSVGSLGPSGGYLVAWEERAVGAPPDIRVRRLNRNGIPLRTAYDLAGGPPFSFAPALPSTDRSTLLLVWIDRNAASDHSILGAEITREGRRLGPERLIVQGGSGPGAVTPVAPPMFPTPPGPPIP